MGLRINWIDQAKGIGILLVILGHSVFPESLKIWLYSFHMPLFFFLSGYVYKYESEYILKNQIIKWSKRLLLMGIYLSIITVIWNAILNYISQGEFTINIFTIFLGYFIQLRGSVIGGLPWYITCLFICNILLYIILSKQKSIKLNLIIGFIASIVGYFYCKYINMILPWALDIALNGILFMILGYYTKKFELIAKLTKRNYVYGYFIITTLLSIVNYLLLGTELDMYSNTYPNYIIYLVGALSGTLMIISISQNAFKSNFIRDIGRYSLIYYCLHELVMRTISLILNWFNIDLSSPVGFINQFISGIVILLLTCIILKKIAPLINQRLQFIIN